MTDKQKLARQDFVDDAIFNMLCKTTKYCFKESNKRKYGTTYGEQLEWDICLIGEIRDAIIGSLVQRRLINKEEFYP